LIPRAHITAWRARAPWPSNEQVEQDLVLSRALIAMFRHPVVAESAVFRGGTALHKLYFEWVPGTELRSCGRNCVTPYLAPMPWNAASIRILTLT